MDDVQFAINEDALAALGFEVEDYIDRLAAIFDKYNETIGKLNAVYQGPGSKKIMEYYQSVKPSFSIVKKNIKNYSTDLLQVIKAYKSMDSKYTNIILNLAEDKSAKAKSTRVDKVVNRL